MSDIKRLGGTTNAVVVQLPERAKPGVVIQHDSMSNLLNLVHEARTLVAEGDWDETSSLLEEIDEIVSAYVAVFER